MNSNIFNEPISPLSSSGKRLSPSLVPFTFGHNFNANSNQNKLDGNSNTSSGLLEFYNDISIDSLLLHPNELNDKKDINNDFSFDEPIVCLINIPSFMIPCDLIKYFGFYHSNIISIRILKHFNYSNAYINDIFMAIIQLNSIDLTKQFINEYNGKILTSLEPTRCLLYPIKNITVADSIQEIENINNISNNIINKFKIDDVCVLCLESFDKLESKSFTTYCNHTFHINCISKLEGPQCPVCRFQHDITSTSLSECADCGWRGNHSSNNRDLWACLVCGYIGCGSMTNSHIQRHYEQSLHTYAMNTDDSRVYDFAGDGYVHRLIINQTSEDESDNASSTQLRNKLVEISNPSIISSERSQIPPLSNEQEEYIINNKLESQAYQYNQLLRWQLERNRSIYETRLCRLRDFALREGQASSKNNQKSWGKSIIQSLNNERNKINKQNELMKTRLNNINHEIEILQQFHSNIIMNLNDYKIKIDEAQHKLELSEKKYRETIPQLERKVQLLMSNLDGG